MMKRALHTLIEFLVSPVFEIKDSQAKARLKTRIRQIRDAMHRSLADVPHEYKWIVTSRIRYARDPEALWFLRSELMNAIARSKGELIARDTLAAINPLFNGLLAESHHVAAMRNSLFSEHIFY